MMMRMEFRIQNPESRSKNTKARSQNPEFRTQNSGLRFLDGLFFFRTMSLLLVFCVLLSQVAVFAIESGDAEKLNVTFQPLPPIERKEISLVIPQTHMKIIPSVRSVLSVSEDEEGTIWIGTENGLIASSKEGDTWSLYNTLNGLCFNRVVRIIPGKNCMWLGTSPVSSSHADFGGLMRRTRKGKGFDWFQREQGLVCNWISDLVLQDNMLYIATRDGLGFLNTDSLKFIYGREGMDVRNLCIDGKYLWMEGSLNVPGSTEMYQFNRDELLLQRFPTRSLFGFDRLVSCVKYEDRMWITGEIYRGDKRSGEYVFEGLKLYDTAQGKTFDVSLPPGICEKRLKIRNIGAGLAFMSDKGFGIYSKGELRFYKIPPEEGSLLPREIDSAPDGSFWMSTTSSLAHLSSGRLTVYHFKNSLSDNYVTSMATAFDSLWAGTGNGAVNRINEKGEVISEYSLGDMPVKELFHDPHQGLYALCSREGGGREALYLYDRDGDKWEASPDYSGDRRTDYQEIPMKYQSLIDELRLEMREGKARFVEGKSCFWLSSYGSGIVRIEKRGK